jgi:hypothetical protein
MAQLRADAPEIIYKFRGIGTFRRDVRDLLERRQVWLARPTSLNDPYDLRPAVRVPPPSRRERYIRMEIAARPPGYPASKVRYLCELLCTSPVHRRRFLDDFYKNALDALGVGCFSRPVESSVLWAHYASNHRGFAVGYRAYTDGTLDALRAFPVSYSSRRPWLYPFGPAPDCLRIIASKSRQWAYEGEWRYVRLADDGGAGLMEVPVGAIVEVRLGLHIAPWHAARVVAAARRLPDQPRILEARLHAERSELLFVPVA